MTPPIFSRSPAGLAHVRLFLGADRIAYCEGQSSFDGSASDDDACHMGLDHTFWQVVLAELYPGERIQCRPVGSKKQVLEQAKLAWAGEQARLGALWSLACVDRDYDDWINASSGYETTGLYYLTDGYCVENDLYMLCGPERLVSIVAPRVALRERRKLAKLLHSLDKVLSRAVKIDVMLRKAGLKIMDTEGVPAFVGRIRSIDDVKTRRINRWIIEERQRVFASNGIGGFEELRVRTCLKTVRVSKFDIAGSRDVPGKTWLKIVCDVLNRLCRKFPHWSGLNLDRISDVLVAEFCGPLGAAKRGNLLSARRSAWANRNAHVSSASTPKVAARAESLS